MAKAYVGTASLEPTGCDLPGVVEGGMSRRTDSESVEPLEGRLGAVCTAKASGISRKRRNRDVPASGADGAD
jgi:hypothetical protein